MAPTQITPHTINFGGGFNSTTITPVISLASIPPGPYLLSPTGALYQPWRLYTDFEGACTQPLIPIPLSIARPKVGQACYNSTINHAPVTVNIMGASPSSLQAPLSITPLSPSPYTTHPPHPKLSSTNSPQEAAPKNCDLLIFNLVQELTDVGIVSISQTGGRILGGEILMRRDMGDRRMRGRRKGRSWR